MQCGKIHKKHKLFSMWQKLYLPVTSLQHSAIIVRVRWIPRTLIPDCGPSPNLLAPVYDMNTLQPNLTCTAPSCVTLSDGIFVGRGTVVTDECYAWKIKQMFKSILLGHKSCCYLQSQPQGFSLENGFREQRDLQSVWYSQATVTKLKCLVFVFSMPPFQLTRPSLIMNADEMCKVKLSH